jgi:hypothetical protein
VGEKLRSSPLKRWVWPALTGKNASWQPANGRRSLYSGSQPSSSTRCGGRLSPWISDQSEGALYVVTWEPKAGGGGGHQLALELGKAEWISRRLARTLPEAEIRIVPAADHAAAAVLEREQRQGRRPTRPRSSHR